MTIICIYIILNKKSVYITKTGKGRDISYTVLLENNRKISVFRTIL